MAPNSVLVTRKSTNANTAMISSSVNFIATRSSFIISLLLISQSFTDVAFTKCLKTMKAHRKDWAFKKRASYRDRTNDLLITSQLLYQLSEGGTFSSNDDANIESFC